MGNQQIHFKVSWSFQNKKGTHRGDFMAPSISELMRILHKSEGVSTTACSEIFVHQIEPGGKVLEVFTFDSKMDVFEFDFSDKKDNVINIVEAVLKKAADGSEEPPKVKPHIRLKVTPDGETVYPHVKASYGRYTAYEAH